MRQSGDMTPQIRFTLEATTAGALSLKLAGEVERARGYID
jgi:hypothetical protein